MEDPIRQMANAAAQKMLRNESISEREFNALLIRSQTDELNASIMALKDSFDTSGNTGQRTRAQVLKKHAPSASAGFSLAAFLALVREFLPM